MNQINYLCIISCLLIIQNLISGQPLSQENPAQYATRPPFPNLLSEIGDMFLQVDETIQRLTSPREEIENTKQEQVANHGNLNPRSNYFNQVRQNYEELQKKIQESLQNPASIFRPPEIMNLNFQNRGQKSFLDLSLPFLPMNVQVRGKEIDGLKSMDDGIVPTLPKVEYPFSDMSGSISIGGDFPNMRKIQSDHIVNKKKSTSSDGFQKRSNHYDMETSSQRKEHRTRLSSKDQTSNSRYDPVFEAEKDEQLISSGSDVEGRILRDLLYSEDTFDKHFKRVLRDGKWVVDPKVFLPKEIIENVREFTRNQLTKNEREKKTGNHIESLLNQNSKIKDNKDKSSFKTQDISESDTHSNILLAFTPEGLPLKLKINTLHGNPLKYLSRVLIAAGVSLNIPIESLRSLQPAGKDVLQLGSRSEGKHTHATYVDLNDEHQLNSLLKALKKSKN